jgi:hypothetical protein
MAPDVRRGGSGSAGSGSNAKYRVSVQVLSSYHHPKLLPSYHPILQEIPKTKFAFAFNGNLKTINMLADFDVKKMELTTDGHGLHYALVCTSAPKRVNQLMYCIQQWNTHQPNGNGICLQAMPDCPEIVTFTKKETHTKHFIVRRILADRDKAASQLGSMYRLWTVESSNEEFHSLSYRHKIEAGVHKSSEGSVCEEQSFDVVKKRKFINSASATVGADITEALLGDDAEYFYNFSNAVMGAFKTLSTFEASIFEEEARWMQANQQCIVQTKIGYAYAAFNPCLGYPPPIKMGATMKDSPYHRLKELSRCLPQSFELLACVPSTDPFAVERMVHAHFEKFRITRRSSGRSTEFFMVGKDTVCQFFAELNQELLLPA